MTWLASIPSPGDNALHLGPLQLRAYGLAIAMGAMVALGISRRRWVARGGSAEDIGAVAVWALPAGLVGARIYHVITDWRRFEGRWLEVFAVWEGGLGIPGGLIAGVGVGVWAARRRGLPVPVLLDVVAPAIPVAQAIGRLGNWFNQELFGRPTDLPWGLEIDAEHRPSAFRDVATFHPTFAYEAMWNLALAAALVLVERHRRLRPGQLFIGYVAGYSVGRLWVEALRVDPASELWGLRINIWTSIVALVVALGVLAASAARPSPGPGSSGDGEGAGSYDEAAETTAGAEPSRP